MIFKSVYVSGYKSIENSGTVPLGPITVLVGHNNSGKSALIHAIHLLQQSARFDLKDKRIGADSISMELELARPLRRPESLPGDQTTLTEHILAWTSGNQLHLTGRIEGNAFEFKPWPAQEPHNLIYPVFSSRRANRATEEQVRRQSILTIQPDDGNIISRFSELRTSTLPQSEKFMKYCRDILGVELNLLMRENGQAIGVQVSRFEAIGLGDMGTGIATALNLLISMAWARDKLFLIEEPETDLHPRALKALLKAIVEASKENQFIISTHSNIVVTHLGSEVGTVLLRTTTDGHHTELPDGTLTLPQTKYSVAVSPEERIDILRDLGYDLADLDLGEGWLIFEESSAESLIRLFLIPWFTPGLRKLRTLAAAGVSRLSPLARDFGEMFVYAHLEKFYKHRAWIIADGDKAGLEATAALKKGFSSWPQDRFMNWAEENFEAYYPEFFVESVQAALSEQNQKTKKELKKKLLEEVLDWIAEDEGRAKEEFAKSAADVIGKLASIETTLQTALSHEM